jgi:lipopolysaccharide transport system ATP-binding protein
MGTISVSNLGKAYKQYSTHWSRFREWITPGNSRFHDLKWILEEISFTVKPGEALGIIGINGAGKSTLLKLITGTAQPTTGHVHMTGRVAAMLELGMGFHPDFTGRQNVFMAGQLLGMTGDEISHLMPQIESFAEIGEYIDMPVRVYSSGMQVRLAFSVATAARPDILIVDEALSVGDAYFQHKSFDRIRQFRKLGTTLLIVSHDKQSIQSICDRAILLSGGRLAMEGQPEAVMDYYNAMLADRQNQEVTQVTLEGGRVQTVSGTGEASIDTVRLLNDMGQAIEVVAVGQSVSLNIKLTCKDSIESLVIGYMIKDRVGQAIFGTNTYHLKKILNNLSQDQTVMVDFDFPANLGPGTYSVAVALHEDRTHVSKNFEWRDHALVFNVVNMDKDEFIGTAWLPTTVRFIT